MWELRTMDEMAPLRRAGSEYEPGLADISPDQVSRPTPCAGWRVRDLISHIVGERIMSVFGLDGDILGADASTAFATAASAEYQLTLCCPRRAAEWEHPSRVCRIQ